MYKQQYCSTKVTGHNVQSKHKSCYLHYSCISDRNGSVSLFNLECVQCLVIGL